MRGNGCFTPQSQFLRYHFLRCFILWSKEIFCEEMPLLELLQNLFDKLPGLRVTLGAHEHFEEFAQSDNHLRSCDFAVESFIIDVQISNILLVCCFYQTQNMQMFVDFFCIETAHDDIRFFLFDHFFQFAEALYARANIVNINRWVEDMWQTTLNNTLFKFTLFGLPNNLGELPPDLLIMMSWIELIPDVLLLDSKWSCLRQPPHIIVAGKWMISCIPSAI